MLIKEYRIPLPLTVEEYRIAQLYMIAKKSRQESSGAGSGVEIMKNEPYTDGPGGQGQYTHKMYHVGSHLPGWLKGILPKTALMVEEEAWNAYPFTKTRYTCPFVEKFFLEIETYYFPDNGHQENVFNLEGSDLRNRIVDVIDVVKDQLYGGDYVKEEDPSCFQSEKTGRGPLNENWLDEYWREVQGKPQPLPNGKSLMCAYKLCRVEFRYWGMQTKIEKFIHDVALRKTMVRAHRQAWAWQDEWHGLTMDDIREIEKQTQLALKRKMGQSDDKNEFDEDDNLNNSTQKEDAGKTLAATFGSIEVNEESPDLPKKPEIPVIQTGSSDGEHSTDEDQRQSPKLVQKTEEKWQSSKGLNSQSSSSIKSFNIELGGWRMARLRRDSASDEEFYDCEDTTSLAKWSSLEMVSAEDNENVSPPVVVEENDDSIFSQSYLQRVASERGSKRTMQTNKVNSLDASFTDSPGASPAHISCNTTVLLLVMHAGSVLDANVDMTARKSDVTTLRGALESVMRQHYPSLIGRVAIRLVSCPSICTESLAIVSSLSPYSFDVSPSCTDVPQITHDSIPIGAIPILASSPPEYTEAVSRTINLANIAYQDFLRSEEGKGFSGRVCLIADSIGSILAYDALCRVPKLHSRHGGESSVLDNEYSHKDELQVNDAGLLVAPPTRRRSSSTSDLSSTSKFEFDVTDLFMFGSPLALVLAYRKFATSEDKTSNITRPNCLQVYNMFHPTDPVAARLEPLLSARFSILPPVNVPRYEKYPLGNGQPLHLLEILQTNPQMFNDSAQPGRLSEVSIQSTVSGLIDNIPLQAISALQQKWWGNKRMDYALYCPEGLSDFPTNALPHLFHASYWESSGVVAFVLRQIGGIETGPVSGVEDREATFTPSQPREKWQRKRTSVKLRNVAANHRASDVIVKDGVPQVLVARFMYTPVDLITLTGEKVDIHVMSDVQVGEWTHLSTEVTDGHGRITYAIPEDQSLGYGMYPVKMVVRGDHTSVDFFLAVVPPRTECVVFSIDGSFTASVSVSGKDPKVRAGAVDVVRHWEELGYLIIYITGRPEMQQRKVVAWLSQHNFPHGLVAFANNITTDPLRHKTAYLNNLVKNHGVVIHAAYGSAKDINVYSSIGLKPKQIFIVGKASKKQHLQAVILSEGYAVHLNTLMAYGGSRPAQGNARMVIPRGYFNFPGQSFYRRKSCRSAKRSTSYPIQTDQSALERSLSARRYQLPKPTLSTIGNPQPGQSSPVDH